MTFTQFIYEYLFSKGTNHVETVDGKNDIQLTKNFDDKLFWYVNTDKYGGWNGSCYQSSFYTMNELYMRISHGKKELIEGEWEEYRTRAELKAEINHLKSKIKELERQAT